MLHRGNEDDKATRILRPCFLMALGSPRDDNGKQYEYLQDSAIQQSVPDAAAFDGLHCVLCNYSCLINSSSERTRTEKPHAPHFDCRKTTSFCTTGFRIKSYSLNSIHHSFGRATSRRNEANRRPLSNCSNTLAKKSHQERSFVSARFQAIRCLEPVFLLASPPSGDQPSRQFRPLRPLRQCCCWTAEETC